MKENSQYKGPIRTVLVYEFTLGDVEDPEIYAAEPLLKWQNSEEGKWIMDNCIDGPTYQHYPSETYGYNFAVFAKLQGPALTEWLLRTNK